MSFLRYQKYKASEVEWIDDIPSHWTVEPLKRLFKIVGGATPKSDEESFWDGDVTWVSPADLSRQSSIYISDSIRKISEAGLHSCGTTLVPQGSIVLSTRAPIGSLAIADKTLCTNQGCKSLVPEKVSSPQYFAYTLLSAKKPLNLRGKGTTFLELSTEELSSFLVPHPPAEEQTAIAAFLDRETAKIDTLIAEQEKLLTLLAEKRQATISHAVTKGLNPDVPMKDSGVEWLGEVPEHWEVVKGSRIGTLFGSGPVGEEEVHEEGSVPFIKVGSLSAEGFEVANWNWYVNDATAGRLNPYSEFVVFPKRGAAIFLNKVNIVKCRALIDPNLMGWKVRPSISSEYVAYLLTIRKLQELADVSTVPQINNKHIEPERFPMPPHSEQEAIVEFLTAECRKLDVLKTESERAIALLKERRSALISAAVTGQIDVRNPVLEATTA